MIAWKEMVRAKVRFGLLVGVIGFASTRRVTHTSRSPSNPHHSFRGARSCRRRTSSPARRAIELVYVDQALEQLGELPHFFGPKDADGMGWAHEDGVGACDGITTRGRERDQLATSVVRVGPASS